MRIVGPVLIAVLACACAAHAQPADAPPRSKPDQAAAPDATALNAAVRAPETQARALLPPGVARTSVERRFERQGATGAVGFLCGRPDSLDERASSQPLGSDPQGRFLGARLSFTF